MNPQELYKDNLRDTNWLGAVVDIEDPKELGRVRVKVFGKFDELENESIPWATPSNHLTAGSSTGSGMFSVPKIGSIVNVHFDNGNLYTPEYTYIQKISDELKEEITGDNYANAHSLIYDTEIEGGLKLFYTTEKGLMIDFNNSQFNIRPDNSIFVRFGESGKVIHILEETISIGKEDQSDEPAVLGDSLTTILEFLLDQLGLVAGITTPGGPTNPFQSAPNWATIKQSIVQRFHEFLSKSVTIDGPMKES